MDIQNAGHDEHTRDDVSSRMNNVICSVSVWLMRDRPNSLPQSESGLPVNRSSDFATRNQDPLPPTRVTDQMLALLNHFLSQSISLPSSLRFFCDAVSTNDVAVRGLRRSPNREWVLISCLSIRGYIIYHQHPTFKNSTFLPHGVFVCSVRISERTAIISLYSINWSILYPETECVYCAVRTESLNTIHVNRRL